jgi:repressor LexA
VNGITERQREILSFVSAFQQQWGAPPTLREIARHFRFSSPTAAAAHLRALRDKGYLSHNPRQARGSRVVHKNGRHGLPPVRIPIYSTLPKFSRPRASKEGFEGWLPFDSSSWRIANRESVFALSVHGDAWCRWHILNGDLLVMERGRTPTAGQVVAILGGEHPELTVFRGTETTNNARKKPGTFQRTNSPSRPSATSGRSDVAVMVALIRMPSRSPEFASRTGDVESDN